MHRSRARTCTGPIRRLTAEAPATIIVRMEHIDLRISHTVAPSLEDTLTPLVAKGLAYQVGEAIRSARYLSTSGYDITIVPEVTLRGVTEQYQDLYLAALQAIAGTDLAPLPKDIPLPIRYTWAPGHKSGIAITVGRLLRHTALVDRRINRLRKYGLITTRGRASTYEITFLATHPHIAEAFLTGIQFVAAHCGIEFSSHLADWYMEDAHKAAQAKSAQLSEERRVDIFPGVR